jgi:oligosaccharyltransferase complex subunit alpha (ribophorin I)
MVVEHSQQPQPVQQKDNTIAYGPYLDIEPYRTAPLSILYENPQPFLTITKMTREIEISHWGNVAVTEDVDMRHDGAKLQGSFSRFDYQRNPAKGGAAVRSVTHLLPPHAHEIYYRDEIGNISSSHVSQGNNKIHLELIPRYPLFGGWKTRFYMGYDLPIQFYVANDAADSSKFMLNISFTPELDLDVVTDDLVLRVILPEGARNIETHLPFSVDAQSTERHYTYLDTHGRPVVVLHKKNVVGEHNSLFQVTYSFTRLSMLQEPFLLVIAYLAFFIFAMAYVRFELSITKEKAVVAETDSRLTDLLLELKSIHAQRSELHNSLLQASKKLGKSKNLAAFSQEKKNIEAALGKCHTDVLKINNELEELDENIAAQVRQIERQEQSKAAYLEQMLTLDTSYRDKRIPKGAYEESKGQFEKFYNKVDEEIDRLVADLTDDLS